MTAASAAPAATAPPPPTSPPLSPRRCDEEAGAMEGAPAAGRGMLVDVGNMLKAFIGLNFMYVAFAFSKAGLVRGALGLVLLVIITEHCCLLLVEVKNAMPPALSGRDAARPPTFADIARFVGGVAMERAINAALVITQFGYCVGYLIFISQTVHDLTKTTRPVWPFIALPLPPLLGLALLRSIRALGPWSLLANAALIVGFVAVVTYIGQHFKWQPSEPSLASFPLFFGQMTAALEGIGLVVPVETSMSNPARFPLVLRIALFIMTAVLMTVGLLGFATFGAETRSILLLNFGDSPVVSVVKCVLVIGILFTYPLQLIPVIQALEGWLIARPHIPAPGEDLDPTAAWSVADSDGRSSDGAASFASDSAGSAARAAAAEGAGLAPDASGASPSAARQQGTAATALLASRRATFVQDPRQVIARVLIVMATAVTAMAAGASFGLFQSLVGSIGASTLAYTAPSLFHVLVFKDRLTGLQKAKNWGIFCFGLLGSIVGTATTLIEIAKVHQNSENIHFTP